MPMLHSAPTRGSGHNWPYYRCWVMLVIFLSLCMDSSMAIRAVRVESSGVMSWQLHTLCKHPGCVLTNTGVSVACSDVRWQNPLPKASVSRAVPVTTSAPRRVSVRNMGSRRASFPRHTVELPSAFSFPSSLNFHSRSLSNHSVKTIRPYRAGRRKLAGNNSYAISPVPGNLGRKPPNTHLESSAGLPPNVGTKTLEFIETSRDVPGRLTEWPKVWVKDSDIEIPMLPIALQEHSFELTPLSLGFEDFLHFSGSHVGSCFSRLLSDEAPVSPYTHGDNKHRIVGMCFIHPETQTLLPLATYAEVLEKRLISNSLMLKVRVLGRMMIEKVVEHSPHLVCTVRRVEDKVAGPGSISACPDQSAKATDELLRLAETLNALEADVTDLVGRGVSSMQINMRHSIRDNLDDKLELFNIDPAKPEQVRKLLETERSLNLPVGTWRGHTMHQLTEHAYPSGINQVRF
eukprot:GHVT01069058.1.p1 GENE.GHVT01069058.1~~GHVT01069058.1.p1  ORF type:complete len:517 (+),score=13.94 GHVT01069058.1:173-1552(+)